LIFGGSCPQLKNLILLCFLNLSPPYAQPTSVQVAALIPASQYSSPCIYSRSTPESFVSFWWMNRVSFPRRFFLSRRVDASTFSKNSLVGSTRMWFPYEVVWTPFSFPPAKLSESRNNKIVKQPVVIVLKHSPIMSRMLNLPPPPLFLGSFPRPHFPSRVVRTDTVGPPRAPKHGIRTPSFSNTLACDDRQDPPLELERPISSFFVFLSLVCRPPLA